MIPASTGVSEEDARKGQHGSGSGRSPPRAGPGCRHIQARTPSWTGVTEGIHPGLDRGVGLTLLRTPAWTGVTGKHLYPGMGRGYRFCRGSLRSFGGVIMCILVLGPLDSLNSLSNPLSGTSLRVIIEISRHNAIMRIVLNSINKSTQA